ncbi:MAG: hypothetical protein AMQ22_01880 [Candidatus Methanofastidiosum methylothiophilum]|uniref:Uncharacterized protein n=1 Tax=Candidatus Methanofastidiosum methylothiophilum TaxID=1705564 RepID=A0A150ITZ4_9EURY|nr:MAG: hypothetical protein AMQ22_01880 [Candidatus Methanofastidiosum methylthiophilus]
MATASSDKWKAYENYVKQNKEKLNKTTNTTTAKKTTTTQPKKTISQIRNEINSKVASKNQQKVDDRWKAYDTKVKSIIASQSNVSKMAEAKSKTTGTAKKSTTEKRIMKKETLDTLKALDKKWKSGANLTSTEKNYVKGLLDNKILIPERSYLLDKPSSTANSGYATSGGVYYNPTNTTTGQNTFVNPGTTPEVAANMRRRQRERQRPMRKPKPKYTDMFLDITNSGIIYIKDNKNISLLTTQDELRVFSFINSELRKGNTITLYAKYNVNVKQRALNIINTLRNYNKLFIVTSEYGTETPEEELLAPVISSHKIIEGKLNIDGGDNPQVIANLPNHQIPVLTPEREQAIYHQVIRYFNYRSKDDTQLDKLIYSTLDYMSHDGFVECISQACWYMNDEEILIDKSDYLLLHRVFVENQDAFKKWHKRNARDYKRYDLLNNRRRVEEKTKSIILKKSFSEPSTKQAKGGIFEGLNISPNIPFIAIAILIGILILK